MARTHARTAGSSVVSVALRLAAIFLVAHVLALALGMFGLVSAVPNSAQFAGNPYAMDFYNWAIVNTGTVDIWTGTLSMLAFGVATLGVRRTLIFFVAATAISASAELTGTKTGWPFGGYEYTGFLGLKLAGRVPYTVPLSWFYMGFASFLLASKIVQQGRTKNETLWSIVLGAWLLMAWDLVLDPAMASDKMTVMHFWVWKEHGAYFGMPLRNLAGWLGTGLTFIAVGRLAWMRPFDARAMTPWLPFGVYAVNVVWAMALSLTVGLWPTTLAAIAFSLLPAALALRRTGPGLPQPALQ
ncbi:MAG: carotenoid biosynthesis protein [Candidatus Eremiobacteraeota bacterium]|nr:carotenoid biosynthesis protein [Candidatus Eremiobacteraeota bacterium]